MIFALLANVSPEARLESFTKTTKMFVGDTLVVFLAGGAVCAAIVIWLMYMRKRRKKVTGGEKVYRPSPSSNEPAEDSVEVRRRYKRRVRRRDHRERKPTLAETGGLPPVRSEPQDGS